VNHRRSLRRLPEVRSLQAGVLALLAACCLCTGKARADECQGHLDGAEAAIARADYRTARQDLDRAVQARCDITLENRTRRERLSLTAANNLHGRLREELTSGRLAIDDPQIPDRVREIVGFATLFQAQMKLGAYYRARHEYRQAFDAYLVALKWAKNPVPGTDVDADSEKAGNERYAAAAAILHLCELVITEGAAKGVDANPFRGDEYKHLAEEFMVRGLCERAPTLNVAVEFEFDKAVPTPQGVIAINHLVDAIVATKPHTVKLTGHTDRTGAQNVAHEVQLSRARAAAVEQSLKEKGYSGDISADGVAYRDPLTDKDYPGVTQEMLDQLNRRVDWSMTCPDGVP
jgi:outer membrane protein OmpA-like peptidoglycan-associated protein